MASKILIVDDMKTNIKALSIHLKDKYNLLTAQNGIDAIKIAIHEQPDLILLDIMMPEMDGFKVCKILKSNDLTLDIPIIFVTAMNSLKNEKEGLDLGAIDYITKPVKSSILLSRIKTHLELKEKRDALEEKLKLEKELAKTREEIEQITRHDMKTPLNSIIVYPKLILSQKNNLTENQIKYLKKTITNANILLNMVNLSLDMYKMEKGTYHFKPVPVNIIPIIEDIIEVNKHIIQSTNSKVEVTLNQVPITDNSLFEIEGEELLFYSMLANLIKNAFEASLDEEIIRINLNDQSKIKTIKINNQQVVSDEIRNVFFQKYSTSGKEKGTGLGTYSALLIAETMNGDIAMESSKDNGTTITISFLK